MVQRLSDEGIGARGHVSKIKGLEKEESADLVRRRD